MYESPISVFYDRVAHDLEKQQEEYIYRSVVNVGVSVDKDELVKALNYDRGQYDKGYGDGYQDGKRDAWEWISVEERLPKEGEFVLVYGDLYPNKHDGGVIAVSKRLDWNYWIGFGRERDITHWMPLPEPPKEDDNG